MQRLEVSGVVRLIYRSLGVKGLNTKRKTSDMKTHKHFLCLFYNPPPVDFTSTLHVIRMQVCSWGRVFFPCTRRPSSGP